jgi:hypothetical protein
MQTGSTDRREIWRKFLRMHWKMLALVAVGVILLLIDAILVFVWFVGNAQSTGLVPTTLDLWTMGNVVTFLIELILWEALFVGAPAIIAGIAGWQWWKKLPSEEKSEYHLFGKGSRATSGGGGGISLLIFIVFCIKVYTDGNWNVAIATWTFNYLAYTWLTALIWVLIILGIPASLALLWWLNREMKKP